MATKAERKEWNDYFPDMEAAIESGAMDDIIQSMKTLIDERVDYLLKVGGVEAPVPGAPGPNETVLTELLGLEFKGSGTFVMYGNNGSGVISPRHYYEGDLVGRLVKIGGGVKPKYMAGMTVRVLGRKQKNWRVEAVDGPSGRRFNKGDVFSCPPSLFDIVWK